MTTIEQLKESMPSGEHPKKRFQQEVKEEPKKEKPAKKGKKK